MQQAAIKVLLADDDEVFLASLRELIDEQPDLAVAATAANGAEALDRAQETEIHAAVLDVHMPVLDGVATVARLRRDQPALCLIVLTGDDDPGLHEAALAAGADAVLQKRELARTLVARLAQLGRNGEGRT